MKATSGDNQLWEIEIDGELCEFYLTEKGLQILRKKHSPKFFSYEDLISKADKQLTLFPLPEPETQAAWNCKCGQKNSGWATECGRCEQPKTL